MNQCALSTKNKMSKLHLGCGNDYKEGYYNMDISPNVKTDVCGDIITAFFSKDAFDEVIVNNCLTQIQDPKDFVKVMNTLHNATKPDCPIYIRVPNAEHICAWQDPMDCRRFTDQTFTYMQHDHRRYEQYGKHYGFNPFKVEMLSNNGIQMEFKLTPVK
jgi:predicted SAM-dependent methyltransferase